MTNEATRSFIRQHAHDDVRQTALRGTGNPEVDLTYALQQIAGRQMATTKIPSWAAIEEITYPPHLSMEQCSSELTAQYKARIAGNGERLVDLTAGFGVDMAFMAKGFRQAVQVERQQALCDISKENYQTLGLPQIEVVCGDGTEYLHTMAHADLLYIDPARRDDHGGRTYGISDCTPNVLEMLDEMLQKADRVLIKLSPMLDWRKAVADVGSVSSVHIVSVDNECKELILEKVKKGEGEKVRKEEREKVRVICVNLLSDGTEQRFEFDDPHPLTLSPSPPLTFSHSPLLFLPNASLMKAGCFDLIASRYGVRQLDSNSHLFVSDTEVCDFPGRCFVIERTCSMNKRELKTCLADIRQANISVRNFPMTVAELRKRLKLKDGGDTYIFATTVANLGCQLLVCRKKP